VDFDYTIYPGIGHGFMAASRFDADHVAYQAACESWTRALNFYRHHLGAAVAA
jgi:dienelactone hydrolase